MVFDLNFKFMNETGTDIFRVFKDKGVPQKLSLPVSWYLIFDIMLCVYFSDTIL